MSDRSGIHSSAIVSTDAHLADDISVGEFAVIGPEVQIGNGCTIGAHAVIKGPTIIGPDNHIYPFASIGDDPQDKKYAGEKTRLEIGEGNTIREYCTINRGTIQDEGVTRIGSDNWLMAYSHVAHDCRVGDHIIMANGATLGGHVQLHDYVMCSAFVTVHQFCRVGAHSFIGAYAGISQDVPPYVLVFGQPTEPRGINIEGLKRRDFSKDNIKNLKEAYRVLYRSGLRVAEAIEQLAERVPEQPELGLLVDFLGRSERGIIR